MRIAIDGNEANVRQKVGVSMYAFELLWRFSRWASEDCQFTIFLRQPPLENMPASNKYFTYDVVPGKALWRDLFLPLRLSVMNNKPDVFFSPAHYTPRFTNIPVVVTIHDISYLYYPDEFLKKDLYKLKNWTGHALSQAKKIIAVSDFTKKDIEKKYSISSKKITTIHNGFSAHMANYRPTPQNNDQYILYVGTLQPRKNIETLVNAFNQLSQDKPDLKLVITGKKGWMYESLFDLVKKLNLEDRVIFKGYVSKEELEDLYEKAAMFVLPSFYEGFGIPILEAMSYGIPVLAAKGSSLEEVGGDACVYFDPHDTMELKRSILELLNNQNKSESLKKKGLERIKEFSWDKCARETLKVLKNI